MNAPGVASAGAMGSVAPAPRAEIDIEALLVWTYAVQKAHKAMELPVAADIARLMGGGGNSAMIDNVGATGCVVPGPAARSTALDADAETVYRHVEALGGRGARVVVEHALRRERPDWAPQATIAFTPDFSGARPAWLPLLTRGGVPAGGLVWVARETEYDKHRNKIYTSEWCPVRWWSPVLVVGLRRQYQTWHAALRRLAKTLANDPYLRKHRPTGPAAPAEPWGPGGLAPWLELLDYMTR